VTLLFFFQLETLEEQCTCGKTSRWVNRKNKELHRKKKSIAIEENVSLQAFSYNSFTIASPLLRNLYKLHGKRQRIEYKWVYPAVSLVFYWVFHKHFSLRKIFFFLVKLLWSFRRSSIYISKNSWETSYKMSRSL
jgi:hypothetical protein